jgi:nucleoside-diphosphate-sugar epimerase
MRVLVTGGGGFIGSHLVRSLLEGGHEVRVLDNFATGRRENLLDLGASFELVEGDIQSYERVHNATAGCEMVLHQAAMPSVPRSIQDPLTSNASNVIGTLNVLLAARDNGVRRVVFASSSSVYGASERLPKDETLMPLPVSPYAVAKLAGEGYCRSFHAVYGIETVALRYFNVFGPRQDPLSQYAAVIPNFLTAILAGRRPVIFGDGTQTRDFTYISNVVDANLAAMAASNVAGQVLNVACGGRISLNEVVTTITELTGSNVEPLYAPPRVGDVPHSMADISRAREALGFEPAVGFRQGLASTVEYFESLALL